MSRKFNNRLKEVTKILLKESKKHGPAVPWYFNSKYPFMAAIPAPVQRQINKKGFSFSNLPEKELRETWTYIWNNSKHFEVMNQALLFMEKTASAPQIEDWRLLKRWASRIDNWAHSDSLCSLYAGLHERYPEKILPELNKWNRHKKPWFRRMSIISLYYYSRVRKIRVPSYKVSEKMVSRLLHDPHVYVQKGVGWTLREMFNVYPQKTKKFLKANVKNISAIAWQAATEKLTERDKKELKRLRKVK